MVSTYFSLLCTSQRLTSTYAYIRASRREHTRESHVWQHACTCARWKYIRCSVSGRFEAIAIYRLQSGSRLGRISSFIGDAWESLISEKIFYVPLLRSIFARATCSYERPPRRRDNTLNHCCHRARAAECINNITPDVNAQSLLKQLYAPS